MSGLNKIVAASDPVDWDQRYRTGDTPWEKGQAHPALVEWLQSHEMTGRVLVPGCGTGHDVRAIAAAGVEVIGLDVSPSAVKAAEAHPKVGGESYLCGDLFAPPASWLGTFDWVVEHTCFCAIPPTLRSQYAASVARLLKPGGCLLGVFYLNPGHDEGGPPYGCTVAELDVLFSAFSHVESERLNIPTYPGREGREMLRLLRL